MGRVCTILVCQNCKIGDVVPAVYDLTKPGVVHGPFLQEGVSLCLLVGILPPELDSVQGLGIELQCWSRLSVERIAYGAVSHVQGGREMHPKAVVLRTKRLRTKTPCVLMIRYSYLSSAHNTQPSSRYNVHST